jgi:hypothetical protein
MDAKNVLTMLLAALDLGIEVDTTVVNNEQSGVALVSLLELLVLIFCLIDRLITSFVVNSCVEFFSSISSSDEMEYSIVADVSQLGSVSAKVIH